MATTSANGLMSSADKTKLNGIAENANNYTHPATHAPSIIEQDANNRFMTDAERNKLFAIEAGANKYTHPSTHPASIIVQDSNNRFMTDAERTKLEGIETGANKYTHPTNHAPSIITQDANNRFVTDTEKSTWNAKASTAVATTSANGLMSSADKTKLNGIETGAQVNTVTSVAGKTGAVTLVKGDVGLGSVDNTADSAKNVASAAKLTTTRTISLTGAVTGSVSFDGSGNTSISTSVGTISASSITVTANSNFGNATTLQGVLNYIANVFAGTQRVTKIRAGTIDVDA